MPDEEEELENEEDEDDDDEEDDDDDEDDVDEDDEDGEIGKDDLLEEIEQCLGEALDSFVAAEIKGGGIELELNDNSRWFLSLKKL